MEHGGERIRTKEAISLRATTNGDLNDLMALWNDGRVMKWVGFPDGLGWDEAKMNSWFKRLNDSANRHHFIVVGDRTGFCGEAYYAVDPVHRRAGLDIKLRVEARGGGRAAAALSALISYAFESELEVDAVWTEPSVSNLAARILYWQCGLRPMRRPLDLDGDVDPDLSYWELNRIFYLDGKRVQR